jgi:gliding motility-associated-like protein
MSKKAYNDMHRLKHLLILPLFFITKIVIAQNGCTTLGQTPSTAFPVCGTSVFHQDSVPLCVNNTVIVDACKTDNVTYSDVNPFWYRFTCYSSGSLGFQITPMNLNDDYDWQIFDITGKNPTDVFTDPSLAVTGNWSGNSSLESSRGYTGITGTSASANDIFVCASNPPELGGNPPYTDRPTFSRMPYITQGHTYLLMVSHFTQTQSGYDLSFNGGTAVITDPTNPNLLYVDISCDRTQLHLKLNKKMKCTSVTATGSDFVIPDVTSKIISALAVGCSSGFDVDSVVINLDAPLPPGNYQLEVKNGSDNNTLLDNCDREIPVGSSLNFVVYGKQPTPLDSLIPPACAPNILQLHFDKNIQCSTIAANGSDFSVTGPYPVKVISANGNACSNGLSKVIDVHLSAPIVNAGTYTIQLKSGDGNTVIDECGEETPAGESISFTVKDTVSAKFNFNLIEGCRSDTINYFNNGGSSITNWEWIFDSVFTSTQQNPVVFYNTFGGKSTQLIVTNGFCSDTTVQNFYLNHDSLKANFTGPDNYCPNDMAYFRDTSAGKIIRWNWIFGNGRISDQQFPPAQVYPVPEKERTVPVQLIVESDKMCFDTAIKFIKVVNNCYIAVPTAFTPNNDGRNDYLYPLNAYKATNLEFRVFNKYGQQLFETKDWMHKWDGTFNGNQQPSGVYVWMLQYTNIETGKKIFQKGTTVLIR